jgi:hypothetical protein
MVRDIQEIPDDSDFMITVRSSVYRYPIQVWVSREDTVYSLKEYMGERMERYFDEMTIVIGQTCPYPLPDDMRLSKLLDEHRNLLLLVHEGKVENYGRMETKEQDHAVWWSQDVPQRYLIEKETEEWDKDTEEWNTVVKRVLDFRFLAKESIPRIRSWLYATRDVSEILLLGTHPHVMEMIQMIAEDVLSLSQLMRVHIQHPMDPDFQLPAKSRERLEHMEVKKSSVTRQGLVYLYQHLLMDMYSDSVERVEIWIDGGLLGTKERQRFVYPS